MARRLLQHLTMRLGLACLLLVTGCDLYFNNGDDDPPCALADIAANELRNPDTGQCEAFGLGCDLGCGPCPENAEPIAIPDWGSCFAGCESLDEFASRARPSPKKANMAAPRGVIPSA